MLANLDPQRKERQLSSKSERSSLVKQCRSGGSGPGKGGGQPPVLQRDRGLLSYGLISGGARPRIFEHID